MDISEELDQNFQQLDDKSKLMVALMGFSQCACAHRGHLALGQLKHAHDFIVTENAVQAAEEFDPDIVPRIRDIRKHLETVAVDPPDYYDSDLAPRGDAKTREFLRGNSFEQPIWYDIRHVAREALILAETRARAMQRL